MSAKSRCCLSQSLLSQSIQNILASGKITGRDRLILQKAAELERPLSDEERAGIQEVSERLQRGWLHVVE